MKNSKNIIYDSIIISPANLQKIQNEFQKIRRETGLDLFGIKIYDNLHLPDNTILYVYNNEIVDIQLLTRENNADKN